MFFVITFKHDKVYLPGHEPNIYTITFTNWDGTVLQTSSIEEGQTPVYTGSTPTRPSDEQYDYTFNGWLPAITEATQDVTYTAQYTATAIPEPDPNYVTFTAEKAGSTIRLVELGSNHTLEYSWDTQKWWTFRAGYTIIELQNISDKVYIRGMIDSSQDSLENTLFGMTGKIAASGNCNALWNYQDINAPLIKRCGASLFEGCASLTTAPKLPATTLERMCYFNMFYGCTSLTTAPELPATTLVYGCYGSMFEGCTSLTQAPELPAITLAEDCYQAMFWGCARLSTIKCLATDISASGALTDWTKNVASIGTFYKAAGVEWPSGTSGIPEGWTVKIYGHYTITFVNWDGTILQTISVEEGQTPFYTGSTPTRPLDGQYNYTFNGWLPAITEATQDVTYTAQYTATTIIYPNIYTITFANWDGTVLQTINVDEGVTPVYTGSTPTRPSDEQYDYTFNGWTPTITAATRDVTYTALYTAIEIPVEPPVEPSVEPYVTFTAEEAGSTIGLVNLGSVHTLEYSTDTQSWTPMTTETSVTLANVSDKVYVRGVLNNNLSNSDYTQFTMTGKIAASGNCNALWNYQDLEAILKNYCGNRMFKGCTSLTTPPELPATTLSRYCYSDMFNDCTSLTQAPALPATTLTMSCYWGMFYGCTSLTQAPILPATTLGLWCYYSMFDGCTSLTTAPELPATTLTVNCYCSMFNGCTSLTTAPTLPATTLDDYCYMYMFLGCTSLSTIKCLATDISATGALTDWTTSVASSGTFTKAAGVEWPTGTSGIPSGWTVVEV